MAGRRSGEALLAAVAAGCLLLAWPAPAHAARRRPPVESERLEIRTLVPPGALVITVQVAGRSAVPLLLAISDTRPGSYGRQASVILDEFEDDRGEAIAAGSIGWVGRVVTAAPGVAVTIGSGGHALPATEAGEAGAAWWRPWATAPAHASVGVTVLAADPEVSLPEAADGYRGEVTVTVL